MLHPIVAQLHPSPEQRPAIRAQGCDAVVTAGAGTGKTRTLVARYLSLLAEGVALRRIVAITFTLKAAREMRNRVREEVRKYLALPDLGQGERNRWQEIYTGLDAARISTIHSLCAEILRAHPAEAGVDPRFEVLDEGQVNILRHRALDETMAWAADDPDAVGLFTLLGEAYLRGVIDTLIKGRLDVQNALDRMPHDFMTHWLSELTNSQQKALDALVGRADWADAVADLRHNAAGRPDDRMELQRQAALAAIRSANGPLGDQLSALSHLNAINLSGGSKRAWPGGEAQLRVVKDALQTLRDLWRSQSSLLALTLGPVDEALAQALPALRAAFALACDRYAALKRDRNALDFDDLEHGALSLLKGNAAVCGRWQAEVGAILVDEFQDTNGRQRELVKLLNGDRGRLFIVGDAKQSIYRFRGADVTVFRDERQGIEREGGAAFTLETSYRAHKALIQGLNDLLRPVLGEDADPERPWAEPFAPLRHHRVEPGQGIVSPHIELILTVGSKSGGALDRAADALAERILKLVDQGVQVVDDGGARILDYGDIAILCRATRSFSAYEDALERARVPFLTVAGRGFYNRPEIRDLLNALAALNDPTDDLALVGLLRSPAFGVSDAALYWLCQERDQAAGKPPLWHALKRLSGGVRSNGSRLIEWAAFERAVRTIGDLHGRAGRTSVADLLKAFLDSTDYRAALIQSGGARGARNVTKLLADAHASGIVGVGEFLEYVSGLRDSGTREGEARSTAEGAVQIMSVHAAKGLEFPVVVIGDATRSGGGGGSVLIDPQLGILLPLKDDDDGRSAIYQLGKLRNDDQETAESDRLLYVAATRAREKLIFSGCISLQRDNTVASTGGWLGRIAGPEILDLVGNEVAYDANGAGAIALELQVGQTPVACTVFEPACSWDWHPRPAGEMVEHNVVPVSLPPPLLAAVSPGTERMDRQTAEGDAIPPRRVWRVVPAVRKPRAPAWVVGSLVHAALAAWLFPDDRSSGRFERWAEARARGYGVTDSQQLVDAARSSRRLLLRFQGHALFQEMDRADRRLHEVPYHRLLDGVVDSGIIDALYQRDGAWTIVEFKTDTVRDGSDFESLLMAEDYLVQGRRYFAAVEHMLGQRPRFFLCMLNYAGTVYLHQMDNANRY